MQRGFHKKTLLVLLFITVALFITGQAFERKVKGKGGKLLLSQADSLFLAGDYKKAAEVISENISISPDSAVLYFNLGLLEQAQGNDGSEHLERSLLINPDKAEINYWMGKLLSESGQLEEGAEYLINSVKQGKKYYEAEYELGKNLLEQGKLEQAEKYLRDALVHGSNKPETVIEFARLKIAQGDTAQAKEILLKSYQRFPYEEIYPELIHHYKMDSSDSSAILGHEYLKLYRNGFHREIIQSMVDSLSYEDPVENNNFQDSVYNENLALVDPAEVLWVGKRFYYKVKYSFIKLGTLEIDVHEGDWHGQPTWMIQYVARSAKGVPFVTINDTFKVHMARDISGSIWIEMNYYEKDYSGREVHYFDHQNGFLEIREMDADRYYKLTRLALPSNAFDPFSMIWYAQQLVLSRQSGTVFTSIGGGYEKTHINLVGPDKELKLAGKRWNTIKIDGILRYSGIVGLTGDYIGWFSADDMGWPLLAKFKIFLGHVKLYLWKMEDIQ